MNARDFFTPQPKPAEPSSRLLHLRRTMGMCVESEHRIHSHCAWTRRHGRIFCKVCLQPPEQP